MGQDRHYFAELGVALWFLLGNKRLQCGREALPTVLFKKPMKRRFAFRSRS